MTRWRQRGDIWQLEPTGPVRGSLEFIGGSYLAATPQLSYRRLLEALGARGWLVRAWSYVPGSTIRTRPTTPGAASASCAKPTLLQRSLIRGFCASATAWAASCICWPPMEGVALAGWWP